MYRNGFSREKNSFSISKYFFQQCCEINGGAKVRKNIEASENKKETSSQYPDTPSSSDQLPQKTMGVYFDDLDHVTFNPINDPEPGSCFNCESSRQTCEFYTATSFEVRCCFLNTRDINLFWKRLLLLPLLSLVLFLCFILHQIYLLYYSSFFNFFSRTDCKSHIYIPRKQRSNRNFHNSSLELFYQIVFSFEMPT